MGAFTINVAVQGRLVWPGGLMRLFGWGSLVLCVAGRADFRTTGNRLMRRAVSPTAVPAGG